MDTTRDTLPPIVDLDWLIGHLPEVILVDVRSDLDGRDGRAVHERAHLPGAIYADLGADLSGTPSGEDGRHPLPTPGAFAHAMGALGIGDTVTVIAYDDVGGSIAARLVWMLRVLGQPAALLDGGLHVWDGPLERGPVSVTPVARAVRPWPAERIAGADDLGGGAVVIDARAAERYRGEVEPIDAVAGHIPGAINRPHSENLEFGLFRDATAITSLYAAARDPDGDDAIVYCGSGVTACHSILAMESVGIASRLYAGSWSQWSSDPSRPVATGEAP